jgi:hypothetical protein
MSVVEARLEEVDPVFADQIDDPVLLGQAPRPGAREDVLERLRLTFSLKRIAQHGVDDLQCAQRRPAVGLDPETQVFQELALEDCLALGGGQEGFLLG